MPCRPWRRYRQSRTALARGHRSQPSARQSSLFFVAGYALPLLQYPVRSLPLLCSWHPPKLSRNDDTHITAKRPESSGADAIRAFYALAHSDLAGPKWFRPIWPNVVLAERPKQHHHCIFKHQKLRPLAVAGQYQSALLLTNWSATGLEWHLHAANWLGYTAVTQLPTMRVGTSEGVGHDSSTFCYRRGTRRPRPIAGVPAGEAKKCGHSGDRLLREAKRLGRPMELHLARGYRPVRRAGS